MQNLSPKQKKIAAAADPKDRITGADFQALRKKHDQKNKPKRNLEWPLQWHMEIANGTTTRLH